MAGRASHTDVSETPLNNPEAAPSRRQQSRDRPPPADRPHLGAAHSRVTLFPREIRLGTASTQAYRKDTEHPSLRRTAVTPSQRSREMEQDLRHSLTTQRLFILRGRIGAS